MVKIFKLLYSPLFYDDLDKITDYTLFELKNRSAAKSLIDDTEAAILLRLSNPLSTEIYQSIKQREHPYRRIVSGSYLIFYVVIDDVMIVQRMLYGRRNLEKLI